MGRQQTRKFNSLETREADGGRGTDLTGQGGKDGS